MQEARATVADEALFATSEERKRVLDIYDHGLAALDKAN